MTEPSYQKIVLEIQCAKKSAFQSVYLISLKVARVSCFIGTKFPIALCKLCSYPSQSVPGL